MSELMGQYLETDPTLTNGQIAPLRLTVDGKVMTDSAGGGGGGGDASASNQLTQIEQLGNIEAKIATETTLAALNSKVTAIDTNGLATEVTLSSLNSKDFSTSAKQDTGNTSLSSIDSKFTTLNAKDFATETTLTALNTKVTAVNTGDVVVSSSALPTGASTSALQTSGNASLTSIDGKITACNTGAVTVSSSALPTGAATESTLSFISSQLGSIDTNTGLPLGQKTLFKNFGANATLNVKSASGSVYSCSCMNLNASARYFQLWNSSTTAGSGTLLFTFLVPANSQIVIGNDYFHINGILFDTGIAFGFSTTATTYTAGTAADQISTVIYF